MDRANREVKYMGDGYFNLLLFITTMGAGLLAYLVDRSIFKTGQLTMKMPVLVGLCFFILFLFVGIAVLLTIILTASWRGEVIFDSYPIFFLCMAGAALVAFGLGALFQWLYGLGSDTASQLTGGGGLVDKVLEGDFSLSDTTSILGGGRNLYGYRVPTGGASFLLGFLRVFFLTIMGTFLGAVMSFATFFEPTIKLSLICSGATAFFGALVMEIGAQAIHLPANICWLLLWLFFAMTIATGPYMLGFKRVYRNQNTSLRR